MTGRKPTRNRKHERGQVLFVLAFVMIGLMLTSALAVDVSFAYVTKARLVKAVDAACLIGMTDLTMAGQGQNGAKTQAQNAFNANYPKTALDAADPAVNVAFSTNTNQQIVTVTGTATIHTIFMGLMPGYHTLTVNASAQAQRGILVMTIVLDRSGSMTSNGGQTALQSAAPTFVNYFSNTTDYVAMTSFASNATTDYVITNGPGNFQTQINSKIANMTFSGATFGPGGLSLAKTQEDLITAQQVPNAIKVVVFFTDGLSNTIQDTFSCASSLGNTLYNYGGYDSGSTFDFFTPSSGNDLSSSCSSCGCSHGTGYGTSGNGLDCNGYPPYSCSLDCKNVTSFYSQQYQTNKSFSRSNISAEAKYRALQTANAMRAEGIYVYSIGLGSDPDQTFLKEIANDPSSPIYDSTQPQGLAVFAHDCPSSTCTIELQQVFQTIASKVLLRLIT